MHLWMEGSMVSIAESSQLHQECEECVVRVGDRGMAVQGREAR